MLTQNGVVGRGARPYPLVSATSLLSDDILQINLDYRQQMINSALENLSLQEIINPKDIGRHRKFLGSAVLRNYATIVIEYTDA